MKVRIKTNFKDNNINNNYDIRGIYNNDTLIYNEDTFNMKIDFLNNKIIRECNDYKIEINFNNNIEMTYKNLNYKVNIPIEIKKLNIDDNDLYIYYIIKDDNNITYHVNWEEL